MPVCEICHAEYQDDGHPSKVVMVDGRQPCLCRPCELRVVGGLRAYENAQRIAALTKIGPSEKNP